MTNIAGVDQKLYTILESKIDGLTGKLQMPKPLLNKSSKWLVQASL